VLLSGLGNGTKSNVGTLLGALIRLLPSSMDQTTSVAWTLTRKLDPVLIKEP